VVNTTQADLDGETQLVARDVIYVADIVQSVVAVPNITKQV
jgi:hypothetical protein